MFLPVRQKFPKRALPNAAAAVRHELESSALANIPRGTGSIAIAVGSRGITNIAEITSAVVGFWKACGRKPFLVPAMGSHGGGTAEGQLKTLAGYGITESKMGCPIVSSLDVISLGRCEIGAEVFTSRDAWSADGIFLINRVKWHTSFAGLLESGVTKMASIGLGKLEGARIAHSYARHHGMAKVIRSVGDFLFSQGKILGGLAILEDASHQTAEVAVLPAAQLIEREQQLLERVKSWMPRIPVPNVDILIVDEIGKNISGTGMDLKVVNRGVHGEYNPWPNTPRIERIFIRSLSRESGGNGVGMGLADVIHDNVLNRVDVAIGRLNAATSGSLAAVRTPLHFASDRECIELLAGAVGKLNPADVTIAWIKNTMELETLALSENLRDEIAGNPDLEIIGPRFPLAFDQQGNLSAAEVFNVGVRA